MKIEQILKVTNGKLLNGTKEAICQNFSTDTRKIKNGDTFIALKGEKYDGNEFVKNAIDKGAKTCIISDENSIEEVDVKDAELINEIGVLPEVGRNIADYIFWIIVLISIALVFYNVYRKEK